MVSCIPNNTFHPLAFDIAVNVDFFSAGDIINGNKGRDGHFARTDLTG